MSETPIPKKAPIQRFKPLKGKRKSHKRNRVLAPTYFNNPYANLTEEERLLKIEKLLKSTEGKRTGRPVGLPDGMSMQQWGIHKILVRFTSHKLLGQIIKDNNLDKAIPEDAMAIEALEKAINLMRSNISFKDQLAASRLILEYTKPKPTTKAEVTINTAEDFLAKVMADEGRSKG